MESQSSPQSSMTPEEELALQESKRAAMFAAIKKMKNNTAQITSHKNGSAMVSNFSAEQIDRFMKNPATYQKQLRQLSNYLYDYSSEYRWLVDYMSNLLTFNYVLDPLIIADEKTDYVAVDKAKLKVLKEVNKMSLPHELSKALRMAWKEDIFYGYEHESKDTYLIQHMSADYCRLSSQDYDGGVFSYEFDFSLFDGNADILASYPDEFQQKYKEYKNTREPWIELSSERAFAFKINEEITNYPLIPFATVFDDIFNLDEYEKIQKARTKMDNFMLLVQEIPLDDKSQNMEQFLISLETAAEFHDMANDALGEDSGVGLITSPMKISSVRTDKSSKDSKDTVAGALKSVFDGGGVSQFLANSDKSTSTGVSKAIIVNEAKNYKILRQIERWINRKLRRMSGRYKFELTFLDTTSFDDGDSMEKFLKAAQNGFPTIEHASAAIGINPLHLHNRLMMNNYGTNYQEMMKPLATSHTQSADEKTGAPKLKDDEISDSGQINRDANTDENKANQ